MPDYRVNAARLTPHRRYNPLRDTWVLVSPQRNERPWQGAVHAAQPERRARFDSDCYLCPGNQRANGERNPAYDRTWVFDNDYPALLADAGPTTGADSSEPADSTELLCAEPVAGRCRVICYSPRHDLSLGDLPNGQLEQVLGTWADQYDELAATCAWVQIFENRGAGMGSSNPHPHGQIWATDYLPQEIAREHTQQTAWWASHGEPLLVSYERTESASAERVVLQNRDWLVVVPWWAEWPFETLLLPRRRLLRLSQMTARQSSSLAAALRALQRTYDALFGVPFPYSMGWHPAPPRLDQDGWQLHAHFHPPLLRSATVRKHMVGFEMFAEVQRDLTPEQAARCLRRAGAGI